MRLHHVFFLWLLGSAQLLSQQPPSSNLIAFDVAMKGDSIIGLWKPICLSGDNLQGYNNQPKFLSDQEILAAVQMSGEAQTDIYAINVAHNTRLKLTATPSYREYSPTPTPDHRMSLIRQDSAGLQELWSYPLQLDEKPNLILPDMEAIGYHCWMSDSSLVVFVVGSPNVLQWVTLDGKKNTFASDAGRCLVRQGNQVLYVHKFSDQYWFIKRYDPETRRAQIITETLPGSEDFVLVNDHWLLMAKDSNLYLYNMDHPSGWHLIQDLAPYGLNHISRMAYRHGKLVLVDSPR